jgi:hypothetical protein
MTKSWASVPVYRIEEIIKYLESYNHAIETTTRLGRDPKIDNHIEYLKRQVNDE